MPGTAAPYPRAMAPSPGRIPVVPQYHGVPRVPPLPGGGWQLSGTDATRWSPQTDSQLNP